MKHILLCMLMTILVVPGVASSQEGESDFARSGGYFMLGGAAVLESGAARVDGYLNNDGGSSAGGGLEARLGARANKWFALEFFFNWSTGRSFEAEDPMDPDIEMDNFLYGVDAKILFLHGRFQPYVLGAFGGLTVNQSFKDAPGGDIETAFMGRAGGGLDIFITKNWVFEAEGTYVRPLSKLRQDYVLIGGGIQYRF